MSRWPTAKFLPDKRQIFCLPPANVNFVIGKTVSLLFSRYTPYSAISKPPSANLLPAAHLPRTGLFLKKRGLPPNCSDLKEKQPGVQTTAAISQCWSGGRVLGREENNASEEEVLLPPQKIKLQRIRKRKMPRTAQQHPAGNMQRKTSCVQRKCRCPTPPCLILA